MILDKSELASILTEKKSWAEESWSRHVKDFQSIQRNLKEQDICSFENLKFFAYRKSDCGIGGDRLIDMHLRHLTKA